MVHQVRGMSDSHGLKPKHHHISPWSLVLTGNPLWILLPVYHLLLHRTLGLYSHDEVPKLDEQRSLKRLRQEIYHHILSGDILYLHFLCLDLVFNEVVTTYVDMSGPTGIRSTFLR
jgi:hypothetical protein